MTCINKDLYYKMRTLAELGEPKDGGWSGSD